MKPDFFLKAISNPDMQDFCSYLEKPLEILEELQYRYRLLSVEEKVKHHNMIVYLKIDKMMNKYLPEMVDNFCNFSFKYRNEEIVKKEETKDGFKSHTAKEVLLQNLAKLIEEIYVIESDFNQNNKFKLLVQRELLTNLGYAPEIQLANAPSKKVILENKFKYKSNIKLDIFKKNDVIEIKKESIEKIVSEKTHQGSLINIILVIGLTALFGIGTSVTYYKVQSREQLLTEVEHIKLLKMGTQKVFAGQGNYKSLTNQVINNAGITPDKMRVAYDAKIIKNIWDKDVTVKPVDFNNKANQGFEIMYSDVDLQTCSNLVSSLSNEFNEFKVNNKVVKRLEDIVNKDIQKCETVSFISSY